MIITTTKKYTSITTVQSIKPKIANKKLNLTTKVDMARLTAEYENNNILVTISNPEQRYLACNTPPVLRAVPANINVGQF